jgi:MYXO-CTERM domain-containing protein
MRSLCLGSLLVLLPVVAAAQTRVDVSVSDGTRLATDLYLPAGDGPFPAILRRTPYGRIDAGFQATAAALASFGYAVVSQDERGKGDSEGTWRPFYDDGPDGKDTVAWIRGQSWSNGRVGMYGGSAEGVAVLLALGEGAALSCGAAFVAEGDLYEGLWPGGAWRAELGTAWLLDQGAGDMLREYRSHEVRDAYWDPVRLDAAELRAIDVPVLLGGGFFDIFAPGTPRTFAGLGATASGKAWLVMGPWTHAGFGGIEAGDLTFSAEAAWNLGPDLIAFFQACLGDGAAPTWPPVRYYVTRIAGDGRAATGRWESADRWPPASTPLALHLFEDGVLRRAAPLAGAAPAALPVDPAAPIPSVGGGNLSTPPGPMDQADVDARADVLVLETPPAEEPVRLAGEIRATIWAASDTTDGDVIARLSQVTPSGRVLLLADGIRRGRFAAGLDAIRPLTPGEPVPFELDLGPIAIDLPPGHALRLAIQGTSAPRYEPNPGVAVPLADAPAPTPGTLTVFRDADRPAELVLPLVAGELPEAPLPGDGAGGAGGTPGGTNGDGEGTTCGCVAGGGPSNGAAVALLLVVLARRRR